MRTIVISAIGVKIGVNWGQNWGQKNAGKSRLKIQFQTALKIHVYAFRSILSNEIISLLAGSCSGSSSAYAFESVSKTLKAYGLMNSVLILGTESPSESSSSYPQARLMARNAP